MSWGPSGSEVFSPPKAVACTANAIAWHAEHTPDAIAVFDNERAVTWRALACDLGGSVARAVAAWALEWGEHRDMRIALCGYEGEHSIPASWECVEWKARGGYGSQGNGTGRENAGRERIWFSPHCLKPKQGLFSDLMSPRYRL